MKRKLDLGEDGNLKKKTMICGAYQKTFAPSCFARALKEQEIAEGSSINQGH